MNGFFSLLLRHSVLWLSGRRDGKSDLHIVFALQSSVTRIVLHADRVPFSRGPKESYRLFGAHQARVPIEGHTGGPHLYGAAVRRRALRPQADLNFAFTSYFPRRGNEVAGARLQRVIALAFFPVHGDGN